ncbi:hypothetical protein [Rhizobium ruizarguesonis]|uniref:hypothetical protein n=1 Tax=Rhizobium ruizarguesonis TaxID=2081791 RepID=UPI003BF4D5C2
MSVIILQWLVERALCALCISAALYENVLDDNVLVNCAPQPMLLAAEWKQRLHRDGTCPQADRMIDYGHTSANFFFFF